MSDPGMGEAPGAPPAWFFVEDGKVVGPLSADDLAACVRAGRVARETLVAPSGSSAWVSAGQIEGLLTAQRPAPQFEATVVSRPAADDLATAEDMKDDVATSETLANVVPRRPGPLRGRARPRPPATASERTSGRRTLLIAVVAGVIVVAVIVALLLRRAQPVPPAGESEATRSMEAPPSIDAARAGTAAPVAAAPVEANAPAAPFARSGVVAAEPPAVSADAATSARDAAEAEIAKLQAAYQAQVASFVGVGGLDPATLRTAADVDERLRQVARLREQNLAVERGLLDIAQGLRARLVELGVPDAQAAALARTAHADLRITPLVQACRLEDEAWAASDDLLGTLRGTLGQWHVRADGDIEFDEGVPGATFQNYSASIERIRVAARGQQDLAVR